MPTVHHGSKNITQWERIERLNPSAVIISSDPWVKTNFQASVGLQSSKFDITDGKFASITSETGTVHLKVSSGGTYAFYMIGGSSSQNIDFFNSFPLIEISNPTNWIARLTSRIG